MDKKYIEALSNFAFALDELVETMKDQKKSDASGSVLKETVEINNTLESIREGIESIKDSQGVIIKNQEELLNISKGVKDKKEKDNIFNKTSSKKNVSKIKSGVSTILLIAGAVLAIGLAFKIIGDVNFAAVISLGIAIPLIATAFILTAVGIKEFGLTLKDLGFTALAFVMMAGALAAASFIMSTIQPIGIWQMLSAIGVSFIIGSLVSGIRIGKFSFGGIAEMLIDLDKVSWGDIMKLPTLLTTMATALMLSSWILAESTVIPLTTLLNLAAQGLALGLIATALSVPIFLFKFLKFSIKDVISGGIMIVAIAATIMISSLLINLGTYDTFPSLDWVYNTSIGLMLFAIPVIALGLLSMTGVGLVAVALGGLMTIMVAGAILATSLILGLGTYNTFPNSDWTLGTVFTIGAFGILMGALGLVALSGIGSILLSLGTGIIVSIASAISHTSNILSEGNYKNGKEMVPWALSTSLLFSIFGHQIISLGILSTFTDIIEEGKNTMMSIAETITGVSHILSGGNYTDGPTEDWGKGVAGAIGGFAPVFKYLQESKIMDAFFGSGSMSGKQYTQIMEDIGYSIISVADIFAKAPNVWRKGPTKRWGEGIGAAIGGFAPVFDILFGFNFGDLFSKSDKVSEMRNVMLQISGSIVEVAMLFDKIGGMTNWSGYPPKKWAEGVGTGIKLFTDTYAFMADNSGWWSGWSDEQFNKAKSVFSSIAWTLVDIGWIFDTGANMGIKFKGYPSKKWAKGVGLGISTFMDVFELMEKSGSRGTWSDATTTRISATIKKIANTVVEVASSFSPLSSITLPTKETFESIGSGVLEMQKVFKQLWEDSENNLTIDTSQTGSFYEIADALVYFSGAVDRLASSLSGMDGGKLSDLASLTKSTIVINDIETGGFGLGEEVKIVQIFNENEESGSGEIKSPSNSKGDSDMKIKDLYSKLEEMNNQLKVIASNSSNLSSYVNELRTGGDVKIEM